MLLVLLVVVVVVVGGGDGFGAAIFGPIAALYDYCNVGSLLWLNFIAVFYVGGGDVKFNGQRNHG